MDSQALAVQLARLQAQLLQTKVRASCPSALGGTAGGEAAAGLDFGLQQLGLQAGELHG